MLNKLIMLSMARGDRHRLRTLAVVLGLTVIPGAARAQTGATSFEELRRILKNGQTIVVTDTTGQRIKGKVREVSTSPRCWRAASSR